MGEGSGAAALGDLNLKRGWGWGARKTESMYDPIFCPNYDRTILREARDSREVRMRVIMLSLGAIAIANLCSGSPTAFAADDYPSIVKVWSTIEPISISVKCRPG